jgi:hypothetical protein
VLIGQDCEREVNQEDQSYGGMQEVCQESGFETPDGRVDDDYKSPKISVCIRYRPSTYLPQATGCTQR